MAAKLHRDRAIRFRDIRNGWPLPGRKYRSRAEPRESSTYMYHQGPKHIRFTAAF